MLISSCGPRAREAPATGHALGYAGATPLFPHDRAILEGVSPPHSYRCEASLAELRPSAATTRKSRQSEQVSHHEERYGRDRLVRPRYRLRRPLSQNGILSDAAEGRSSCGVRPLANAGT